MNNKSILYLVIIILLAVALFLASPFLKAMWLQYDSAMQEIGETSYQNRKDVEDTCRAMIASYKADIDIYNLYKDSDDPNQKNYADAALVRAIQTANTYNEYILKNSFVWDGNVPKDIYMTLETNIK